MKREMYKVLSIIALISAIFYTGYAHSEENEPGDLGSCSECHKQVCPTRSLDKYEKEKIEVYHGKNESTFILSKENKPVLYRYEKDDNIFYFLPSRLLDNPHVIE